MLGADVLNEPCEGKTFKVGVDGNNATLNNGLKDVPSRLLTPIEVNKDNIDQTVIKDGFHKKSEL